MVLIGFESKKDVLAQYDADKDALDGADLLLAWYGYGDYDGQSIVLFRKKGKLYEVNGSHCSCYGLEGQWSPEETSIEAIMKREFFSAPYYDGEREARAVLKALAEGGA